MLFHLVALWKLVKSASTEDARCTRVTSGLMIVHSGDGLEFTIRIHSKDPAILLENTLLSQYDSNVQPEDSVIDIGAHIGTFCIPAAKLAHRGRVYAFEPEETNFDLLATNVQANRVENVIIDRIAVGGHDGKAALFVDRHNTGGSSTAIEDGASAICEVPMARLETLVRRHSIPKIDLLKIDAEGAEYEILYGCRPRLLGSIRRIVLEYHDIDEHRLNGRALKRFLEESDFKVELRRFPGAVIGLILATRVIDAEGYSKSRIRVHAVTVDLDGGLH